MLLEKSTGQRRDDYDTVATLLEQGVNPDDIFFLEETPDGGTRASGCPVGMIFQGEVYGNAKAAEELDGNPREDDIEGELPGYTGGFDASVLRGESVLRGTSPDDLVVGVKDGEGNVVPHVVFDPSTQ